MCMCIYTFSDIYVHTHTLFIYTFKCDLVSSEKYSKKEGGEKDNKHN